MCLCIFYYFFFMFLNPHYFFFFFFNDTATPEIYPLSLHDALPILRIVDALKLIFTPFLPFSSQKLHELLGYDGWLAGPLEFREIEEEDGQKHIVLTGDYGGWVERREPSDLPGGPKTRAAARVVQKLGALVDRKAVAIGEIGLDFFRDYAPRKAQREVFAEQLRLAGALGTAVIIHSRAADDETAAALEHFDGTVVLHCFSSPELLPIALERGYYVSFAGNATYPKAEELREAARRVPVDRLLVETDSPYLSPQPRRGRPNEPANVVHTAAALAEARGDDAGALAAQLDANAATAFSLS